MEPQAVNAVRRAPLGPPGPVSLAPAQALLLQRTAAAAAGLHAKRPRGRGLVGW